MRNRAKCRLCGDIIESLHRHDFVTCKCNEIFVDGGNDYLRCGAGSWDNFLRVKDNGEEISVSLVEEKKEPEEAYKSPTTITIDTSASIEAAKPTRKELLERIKTCIKDIERLPDRAMELPLTHYDYRLLLSLLLDLFSSD